MMKFRRVVTGLGKDGKAHFVSDGPALSLGTGATGAAFIWASDSMPTVPTDGKDQATADRNFMPEIGGSRYMILTFEAGMGVVMPEGDNSGDSAQSGVSVDKMSAAKAPPIERLIMHATASVDYVTVLSGEIDLILDSGEVVKLGPSDTVIQNGTMHGWRNASNKPCVLAITVLGTPTREA